jgi:hypothetical protein
LLNFSVMIPARTCGGRVSLWSVIEDESSGCSSILMGKQFIDASLRYFHNLNL